MLNRKVLVALPFKRQSHKMVKHTRTIRQQFADELFECVWLFCEIGAWRVNWISTREVKIDQSIKFG